MQCDLFHTDFCPSCGALVQLDTLADAVICHMCHSQRSFQEFAGKVMKTELPIRKDKEWLHKYEGRKMRERRLKTKMIIKENCQKCDNTQMRYFVLQTRSVDEGSTVFYECENCGYNYSVNN